MAGTAVPDVLAALVAAATAAAPSDTAVLDGPAIEGQLSDYVCIGSAEQGPGVILQEAISDYGLVSPTETFDVVSEIVAWQADTNLSDCRTRAKTVLDGISSHVRADPQLGGVVMLAQLIAVTWTQMQTQTGAMVVAQFTVRAQASKQ